MRVPKLALVLTALPLSVAVARAQTTTKWSCYTNFGYVSESSVSGDGRYLVYAGTETLSLFPFTQMNHVYIVDTVVTFAPQQIITTSDANATDWLAWHPKLSADGRFVLFTDVASHVPADTNSIADVYVYDRVASTYELISVNPLGNPGNAASTTPGSISADGRYVAFTSDATDLVAGDANGLADVFLRDRVAGTTELISVDSSAVQGNGSSRYGAVSDDGRYVAFQSTASNLVLNDAGGFSDVFLRDRLTSTTKRLSVDSSSADGNGDSRYPSISSTGRFVAFESNASNLTPTDTNGFQDIFVRDALSDVTRRVSIDSFNAQANADCSGASISADGRYVTFSSAATTLVAGDVNGAGDVFIRDRTASVTELVSLSSSGTQGNNGAGTASISAGGRFVTFISAATNLAGSNCSVTPDTNVYMRDRGVTSIQVFCRGDGVISSCVCGNNSPAGTDAGCLNSLGTGASLLASGNASLANDTLVLQGSSMPNSSALYFQGTTEVRSNFGDGLRCAGGTIVRINTVMNSGGASQLPLPAAPPISVSGGVTSPGTRTYQIWYRNAAAFCASQTFNLSNGLDVPWTP